MKRNVLKSSKKFYGRYVFFITGLTIAIILFLFSQTEEGNAMDDTSFSRTTFEEDTMYMGSYLREDAIVMAEEIGMGARLALLDKENPVEVEPKPLNEDKFVLEQIVFAESGTVSQKAQKGVANAILNRVDSDKYPDSIKEVVFEKNQFSPAENDGIYYWYWPDNETSIYKKVEKSDITDDTRTAVNDALMGDNPIGNYTGFYSLKWISSEEYANRERTGFTPDYDGESYVDIYGNRYDFQDLMKGTYIFENCIVIDGLVFHGDWV